MDRCHTDICGPMALGNHRCQFFFEHFNKMTRSPRASSKRRSPTRVRTPVKRVFPTIRKSPKAPWNNKGIEVFYDENKLTDSQIQHRKVLNAYTAYSFGSDKSVMSFLASINDKQLIQLFKTIAKDLDYTKFTMDDYFDGKEFDRDGMIADLGLFAEDKNFLRKY